MGPISESQTSRPAAPANGHYQAGGFGLLSAAANSCSAANGSFYGYGHDPNLGQELFKPED
jgi:hypothetical protein